MAIKLILLLAFFACMIGVGIYCRRSAADVHGFVLGGRSVGPWLTAFAYGTSYFSAVIFIGYAGQFGWKYGLASTWIGLGNAFIGSLLAWVILGRRTRLMTQKLDSKTMPAFFGSRFSSPALKIAASVIVFIFMIPYTASLFNGLSRLFKMAFGIDYVWCVLMMAVLTGIYVVVGGYMATAINDFIQGIIMLFGIVIVILAVLRTNGGFTAALSTLSSIPAETNPSLSGAFSASMSTLSSLVLTSSSTLTLDLIVPSVKKKLSEKSQMTIIRVLIVFFIAISAVIAIVQHTSSVTFIAQLMGVSWGALAGAFLAPFLYSLYSKKITKAAVWASYICGVGLMTANLICTLIGVPFLSASLSSPINAGVLAMVVGLVVVPLVSLFTKKPDSAMVDEIFTCYEQTVTVHSTTSLPEDEQ